MAENYKAVEQHRRLLQSSIYVNPVRYVGSDDLDTPEAIARLRSLDEMFDDVIHGVSAYPDPDLPLIVDLSLTIPNLQDDLNLIFSSLGITNDLFDPSLNDEQIRYQSLMFEKQAKKMIADACQTEKIICAGEWPAHGFVINESYLRRVFEIVTKVTSISGLFGKVRAIESSRRVKLAEILQDTILDFDHSREVLKELRSVSESWDDPDSTDLESLNHLLDLFELSIEALEKWQSERVVPSLANLLLGIAEEKIIELQDCWPGVDTKDLRQPANCFFSEAIDEHLERVFANPHDAMLHVDVDSGRGTDILESLEKLVAAYGDSPRRQALNLARSLETADRADLSRLGQQIQLSSQDLIGLRLMQGMNTVANATSVRLGIRICLNVIAGDGTISSLQSSVLKKALASLDRMNLSSDVVGSLDNHLLEGLAQSGALDQKQKASGTKYKQRFIGSNPASSQQDEEQRIAVVAEHISHEIRSQWIERAENFNRAGFLEGRTELTRLFLRVITGATNVSPTPFDQENSMDTYEIAEWAAKAKVIEADRFGSRQIC